jgi:hypothetical protein
MVLPGSCDNILLSTSDTVYVNETQFPSYFKWMYANNIMNSVVFRSSYQWSGTRTANEDFYRKSAQLCRDFSLPYSLMLEGRTLPGCRINPDEEWIESNLYLGAQAHEDDGAYYYWGSGAPYRNNTLRRLMERFLDWGGIFPKFTFSDTAVGNMKEGADYFVQNLSKARGNSTRHTGPTVLFRYFYQAGYQWLGAEQFYGPEEITLSALRGASKAYGKSEYGTHHATQWGYPRTWEVEGQFQSHALAYMHGVTHINTEDALWNTENCNHRFSEETRLRIQRQKDIMDFIKTHRRGGEMVVKIAVLQGKNDGWACYGQKNVWGQSGSQWEKKDAEDSYDLLKLFYPRESLHDFSVGGTPFGPIDILPVEAPLEVMHTFDALIFLGWNTYDEEQFDNLYSFVANGGTLLMSRAHLNTNLSHNAHIEIPSESEFYKFITSNIKSDNNSSATPVEISLGDGVIIFFNSDSYPASKEIRGAYEEKMVEIGNSLINLEKQSGWIRGNSNVGFTVWDKIENSQTIRSVYLLNLSEESRETVTLLLGENEFPVDVEPGIIKIIYIYNGVAISFSDTLAALFEIEKTKFGCILEVSSVNSCTMTVLGLKESCEVFDIHPGISKIELNKL